MSKSFKDKATAAINPALAFISQTPQAPEDQTESKPLPTRAAPRQETKSRRLQVLIKPSTHEKIKELAEADGMSVNDWINKALEREIKKPISGNLLDDLLGDGEES